MIKASNWKDGLTEAMIEAVWAHAETTCFPGASSYPMWDDDFDAQTWRSIAVGTDVEAWESVPTICEPEMARCAAILSDMANLGILSHVVDPCAILRTISEEVRFRAGQEENEYFIRWAHAEADALECETKLIALAREELSDAEDYPADYRSEQVDLLRQLADGETSEDRLSRLKPVEGWDYWLGGVVAAQIRDTLDAYAARDNARKPS